MSKCPRCFTLLSPEQPSVDAARPGRRHPIPRRRRFGLRRCARRLRSARTRGPARPGYNGPPPPTSEASRALQGPAVEVCPVCHFTLPDGFREGHAICIALAGARATGKSLYIAVLVKQLELLCERFGVVMEPVTRATAQNYATNYEGPLYVHRGLLPPTPTVHTQAPNQREPLVFSIGVWHGCAGSWCCATWRARTWRTVTCGRRPSSSSATPTGCSSCSTRCGSRPSAINCRICCRPSRSAVGNRVRYWAICCWRSTRASPSWR